MSDKKISELDIVSSIDHSKDYVLAVRDGENYRVRIGDIIDESKEEIPTRLSELINDTGFIVNIPGEYVTESELSDKGYLTEHQDLTDYAKKSDISDEVNKIITDENFITSIPDEYITEDELEDKGYLTEHQDLSDYAKKADIPTVPTEVSAFNNDANYATESYVDSAISDAQLGGGDEVDLSNYAKKDEIPTVTSQLTNDSGYISSIPDEYITEGELDAMNYATQSYVAQKISEAALDGSTIEINYSTTTPLIAGTAARGTENAAARGDHVHPAQTTITGNAGTATTLQTARTINGTAFNGSANITTNSWGTARTITVGNTSKTVSGSGDVSWTLSDIGAAASSHTHSGYAASSHTHSEYASSTHNHDSNYAAKTHTHSEYSPTSHTHTGFAAESHNHDSTYSKISHTHSEYASSSHNHDSTYLKLSGGTLTGTLTARSINPSANNTYELGTESMKWHYVNTNGVSTTSDREAKENINYIRNNENENRVLDDGVDETKAPNITYANLYEFVRDDLELATYNLKDVPKYRLNINFIAQDLLYNIDESDNVVGQIIVPPLPAPTDEEAELYGTLDEEGNMINAPTLLYDSGNYMSVLAGALKQSIKEIELLKEEIQELKSKLDN